MTPCLLPSALSYTVDSQLAPLLCATLATVLCIQIMKNICVSSVHMQGSTPNLCAPDFLLGLDVALPSTSPTKHNATNVTSECERFTRLILSTEMLNFDQ